MPRMRTIQEAAKELRETDPNTALTPYAIRQMVLNGTIPSDNQNVYQMETQVRLGKSKIPPLSPKGGDRANLFETFYSAYPKHQAKKQALKAFEKLNPYDELFAAIMAALENQKQSDQWQRDNGQFIPLPATWLNGRRWEDEPTAEGKADKPQNKELTPEEKADIWEFINQ